MRCGAFEISRGGGIDVSNDQVQGVGKSEQNHVGFSGVRVDWVFQSVDSFVYGKCVSGEMRRGVSIGGFSLDSFTVYVGVRRIFPFSAGENGIL